MPYKDPEEKREHDKQYRLNNLERLREYDRQRTPGRYQKNPEAARERRRRYYARHTTLELSRKAIFDEAERVELEINFRSDRRYIYRMWYSARKRATKAEVPFDISLDDIVIPEICPVLGIKLQVNRGCGFKPTSPSLDRKIPSVGYVKGNVRVISYRANEIKRDATLEELEKVIRYLQEE